MAYVWQESEHVNKFVGARRHLPYMKELFDHAVYYIRAMKPSPKHLVDIGCGTGVTGGALLDLFPAAKLTLSDFSEPMLEQARKQYAGDGRVNFVNGDLSQPGVMAGICPRPVDVIVSSLAIHHLPRRRQMSLYGEIFEALEPGGLFVNIEHTASATPAVSAIYWNHMYDHVVASMNASGEPTTKEQVRVEFEKRQHVNILTPVDVQVDWLRRIGFEDADCLYRSFELSVFAGRRPM